MNWITNLVRPKVRALVKSKDVPDNMWEKCPNCDGMLFYRELKKSMHVCHHCDHHLKIDIISRLDQMFDDGNYDIADLPKPLQDPLKFKDSKKYPDRLKAARSKTGRDDAIVVAHGNMGKRKTVIAAFDPDFIGGSMGLAVGNGLIEAAKLAVLEKAPLIIVTSSGGARMQEGILSLMQMPRGTIAVEMVKEAGLPYIVLLTHPTTGGVSASFAMLGDIHIAEPGALIGFAGPRVIRDTIREELPEGFQTAEYLKEHGMVDMVVHRNKIRETLISIFGLLMKDNGVEQAQIEPPADDEDSPEQD